MDDTFRIVKPSNSVDMLILKYIFSRIFRVICFEILYVPPPKLSGKLSSGIKFISMKFSKGRQRRRKNTELNEEQASKPFKIVLECKVNGHYLVKQTSHLLNNRTHSLW